MHWVRIVIEDAINTQNQIPRHVRRGFKRIVEIIEASDFIQFRDSELEYIAEELSCCTNLKDLSQLLWRATTSAGFQNFCLFVVEQGNEQGFGSRLCTSYSIDWLKCYESNRYQYVDPVHSMASVRDGSFLYSETKSCNPMVQEFWDEVEKYKIGRNGFCYAATRPSGARLGISFSTGHTEEKANELIRLNRYDLEAIAELAIECFCYLSASGDFSEDILSIEELRFLHTLATNPQPEKALLLASKFGGNKALQASIRCKLNVATVFQAVAIASTKRWFDLLPYNCDEAIRPFPVLSGWHVNENDERVPVLANGFGET